VGGRDVTTISLNLSSTPGRKEEGMRRRVLSSLVAVALAIAIVPPGG
jgi:hypothetical protein